MVADHQRSRHQAGVSQAKFRRPKANVSVESDLTQIADVGPAPRHVAGVPKGDIVSARCCGGFRTYRAQTSCGTKLQTGSRICGHL